MEDIIKLYKNIKFINATEGGAKIEGTIPKAFDEICELKLKGENYNFEENEFDKEIKNRAIFELENLINELNSLLNFIDATEFKDTVGEIRKNYLIDMLLYYNIQKWYSGNKEDMEELIYYKIKKAIMNIQCEIKKIKKV